MKAEFVLENIKAGIGEKAAGYIPVADCDGNESFIPVYVINGAGEGPTLCLTAGVHGCEYASIEAVIRMYQEIDPLKLGGTVIGVPVLNVDGFRQRMPYVSPWDGKNINRIFPGKPDGTMGEVLAYNLIEKIIPRADYHIDLHGGDMSEYLKPYGIVCKPSGDDRMFEKILEMAKHYLLPLIVVTEPGRGRSYANAVAKGVPSMLAEAGENGLLDEESLNFHRRGLFNVMRFLGMLPGKPEPPGEVKYASTAQALTASRDGLFYPVVQAGDTVEEGQKVGELRDFFGNVIEELRAPHGGFLTYLISSTAVLKDGILMGIAPVIDKP